MELTKELIKNKSPDYKRAYVNLEKEIEFFVFYELGFPSQRIVDKVNKDEWLSLKIPILQIAGWGVQKEEDFKE